MRDIVHDITRQGYNGRFGHEKTMHATQTSDNTIF